MGTAKELQLSMLGAIPPFVGMLDLEDFWSVKFDALYAICLYNLGIGNGCWCRTKLPLFKAGAVHYQHAEGRKAISAMARCFPYFGVRSLNWNDSNQVAKSKASYILIGDGTPKHMEIDRAMS
ncbi:hypothetical protein NC653_017846 [Populus alba x Populus x berolinensis]|uniref:Uncharacterized protein n=1 Tax=Populus alba x Populus x berolinensis TaxID=444605 RepID=A0AAD6QRT7_9ROSI|nr:hypothetical protein NC653_017846 [Populus alba x Populus x berolinensis]